MKLTPELKQELIPYLSQFVTEKRKERFETVLEERTSHIQIVLEDIFQTHNASAVLRSAECFGIQHIHFIENRFKFKVNDDIALGSSKWLTIHRHNQAENNTREVLMNLKKKGYRIIATSPHEKSCTIKRLAVDKKLVLLLGTELDGLSSDAMELADEFVTIPMYGFTESFNISVSAALCLYELSERIRNEVPEYKLQEPEKLDIYFEWLKESVQQSDGLIERYFEQRGLNF